MDGQSAAAFFVGFFSAVCLYNALVFATTRNAPFLWYAGTMAAMIGLQCVTGANAVGDALRMVLLAVYFGCASGFAIAFLRLREREPAYANLINVMYALNVVGIMLEHAYAQTALHRAIDDAALIAFLAACGAAGWRSSRDGFTNARFYLLAFAGAVLGVLTNDVGEDLRIHTDLLRYAFPAGMAWEALFLALALAGRVRAASVDEVTGVPNRRAFEEALPALWRAAQQTKTPLAIVFVDVDDFKRYNDRNGHLAGDALLRRIAMLCAGCCRDRRDMFARYGGDEFVALLPRVSEVQARIVAERMQRLVADSCRVTISVGVASSEAHDRTIRELLAHSDHDLYRAKAQRRAAARS